MDPLTALLNFGAALLNYLSTPVGQKTGADWHARAEKVMGLIDKVWDKITDRVGGNTPPQTK